VREAYEANKDFLEKLPNQKKSSIVKSLKTKKIKKTKGSVGSETKT